MSKRNLDEQIPTFGVHFPIREVLQAEADRRPGGAKLPQICREALLEYIEHHGLMKKYEAEQAEIADQPIG